MRYAISDIHGCRKTLEAALDRTGPGKEDELFFLGDYIDRGPDSAGVMRRIIQLAADGYRVTALRGNHEQMLIDAIQQRQRPYDWVPSQNEAQEFLPWLDTLGHYAETPGYLLVHAGLNFAAPDPLKDLSAMLWARYWEGDTDRGWLGDRTVVYGHTPSSRLETERGIRYMQHTQRVCIDAGCPYQKEGFGYLTVLNLDTHEGTFVRRIDEL